MIKKNSPIGRGLFVSRMQTVKQGNNKTTTTSKSNTSTQEIHNNERKFVL